METNDYMKILQHDIHSVVLASNDENGRPVTSYMDVMHADESGIYFLTSKGKEIYQRMIHCDYVALTGMTGTDFFHSKMISIRGRIKNIGSDRVEELFDENPYMYKIYPTSNNRGVVEVFCVYEGQGEYFNFSQKPSVRSQFTFGNVSLKESGYYITESCNECGICAEKCPEHCIEKGIPYIIKEENCLRCGNCYYNCPQKAVKKYN